MAQSFTPLPQELIDNSSSNEDPDKLRENHANEKYSSIKKTLIEGIIVFLLLMGGLLIETFNRGILLQDNALNIKLLTLLFQRSLYVTLIFVLGYRAFKSSILLTKTFLSFAFRTTKSSNNKLEELLNDIFLTLGIILLTMPVRPIIQEAQVTTDTAYITQAFVRFDAYPSILILIFPAIPLILLINKYKQSVEKYFHIAIIIAAIVIVGYFNSQPNYNARVYESRASWVTHDWQNQEKGAQEALMNATTNDEKAIAYFWLGVAANRQKNYQQAIEYQLMAIDLVPDYAAAHASLANGYLFSGQVNKSLEHANKCVNYDPKYAWCYSALANYYGYIGEIDTAIANAKKANELDPYEEDLQKQLHGLIEFKENNK